MFQSGNRLSRRHVLASGAALAVALLVDPGSAHATAPMFGVNQPTHYRLKFGAFELTTILDANAFIDGPWPLIGTNASEREVDQLMPACARRLQAGAGRLGGPVARPS